MQAGDLEQFRRSLDAETDVDGVDEQGWTALGWAAGLGHVGFIDALLQRGADVFKRGRDERTPYLIALAAGRADAVERLRAAEETRGGDESRTSSRQGESRPYCRAYPSEQIRAFPAWPATASAANQEEVVFLHQDGSVTAGALHGQDVLWASDSPEWRTFCRDVLGFRPPTDADLLSPA